MSDGPRTREIALPLTAADLDALRAWVDEVSQAAGCVQMFRVIPRGGEKPGRLTFHDTTSLMRNVGPRGDATRLIIDCLGSA